MKSTEFCYWMQGFFEVTEPDNITPKQLQMIKNHLKLVFLYDIDPSYTDDPIVKRIFQNIHDGKDHLDGIEESKKKHWKELFNINDRAVNC